MKVHKLKTVNPYFKKVWNRKKLFELRKNDRNFKVNDKLILQEYDSKTEVYSGREIHCKISYIVKDCPDYGVLNGFAVLSLSSIKNIELNQELKKTSEEWNKFHKIEIFDPDGWDRNNFQYSFYEELLTEQEFIDKLMRSTLTFDNKDASKEFDKIIRRY